MQQRKGCIALPTLNQYQIVESPGVAIVQGNYVKN